MFWPRRYDAFISYSHKDQAVVEPLVELLSLNERRVFWDHDLNPGDRWDEVIRSKVKGASIFVLFWCCDTRDSHNVAEEIALALRLKKKIVPVKLCSAAMPPPLGEWQWIDPRERVQHVCGTVDHRIAGNTVQDSSTPLTFRSEVIGLEDRHSYWNCFGDDNQHSAGSPKESNRPEGPLSRYIPPGPDSPGVVKVSEQCFLVLPRGRAAGSIMEVNRDGKVVHRYWIPPDLPGALRPGLEDSRKCPSHGGMPIVSFCFGSV